MSETFADGDPMSREELGRMVRLAWIQWATEQPNPKASWLVPWEQLAEADKEADRRIGVALHGHFLNCDLPKRIASLESSLASEKLVRQTAEARVAKLRDAAAEYVAMMDPAPGESPLGPVTAAVHGRLVAALSALDAPPATKEG